MVYSSVTKFPGRTKRVRLLLCFYLQELDGLSMLLLSAQLGCLDEHGPRVTRILRLKAGRQFPALVGLRGRQRAGRMDQRAASYCSGGGGGVSAGVHLVGVHGQQGFVQVDSLELLLHQLVLDALGVGQLHLLLGVKHVLVLLFEQFGSGSNKRVLRTSCTVFGVWL